VSKFYELREPQQMGGKKWIGKWVVKTFYAHGGEPFGFLHDDSELYDHWLLHGTRTLGLFDSRYFALAAAKIYYDNHNEPFPYLVELIDEFAMYLKIIGYTGSRPLVLK